MHCIKHCFEHQLGMHQVRVDPSVTYRQAKNDEHWIQRLQVQHRINAHNGCVNTISWNAAGTHLLSGSDDQYIIITNPFTEKQIVKIRTGHSANIFSAKFLPNTRDNNIVSCSGDGMIYYTDINRPESGQTNAFSCHQGTCYEVVTVPNDSHTFLSCGEDGTVRWFDLRTKERCSNSNCREDILINCRRAVTSLAVNPSAPYQLAVGCADSSGRLFDRRMLGTRATGNYLARGITAMYSRFTPASLEGKSHRVTSLEFSHDGWEILVSYSSDYVYLFDLRAEVKPSESMFQASTSSDQNNDWLFGSRSTQPIKRLRVRGDWSDTGPEARPEHERGEETSRRSDTNLMQRMSDMLTRWFEDRSRQAAASNSQNEAASAENEADDASLSARDDNQNENVESRNEAASTVSEAADDSDSRPDVMAAPAQQSSQNHAGVNLDVDSSSTKTPASPHLHSDGAVIESMDVDSAASNDVSDHVIKDGARLEAVLDLEYHTRGTSNSTIKVDFTESTDAPVDLSDSGVSSQSGLPSFSSMELENAGPEIDNPVDDVVGEVASCDHQTESGAGENDNEFTSMQDDDRATPMTEPTDDVGQPSSSILRMTVDGLPVGSDNEDDAMDKDDDDESDDDSTPRASSSGAAASGPGRPSNIVPNDRIRCLKELYRKKIEEKRRDEDLLRSIHQPLWKHTYVGHRNARTMIKEATFYGDDYIMSGSDCGHVFVWNRHNCRLVMLLEADKHVVNCIQPHPTYPILATSGIDYDVKIWMTSASESLFNEEAASEVVRRNDVMLQETRDTITVPATFMLRMLASLNHMYGRSHDLHDSDSD